MKSQRQKCNGELEGLKGNIKKLRKDTDELLRIQTASMATLQRI
jgi:hypothetical protein